MNWTNQVKILNNRKSFNDSSIYKDYLLEFEPSKEVSQFSSIFVVAYQMRYNLILYYVTVILEEYDIVRNASVSNPTGLIIAPYVHNVYGKWRG